MNYTGKQSKQSIEPTQNVAQAPTVSVFADQRASTAMQLKQQQIMHAAHSPNVIQQMTTEEEPIQGEFENEAPVQLQEAPAAKPNNTGLPDNLKSGIENLSGYSMDDVKIHYNSDKPAQLNAHAYAQGTNIHVAPGQEQHLPHEAWHVVQQKQGRVQAKHCISTASKVAQAKTKIKHTTSTMKYDTLAPEVVGVSMSAELDPLDKVVGSATDSPNTPMYSALWASHKIVRGHLLNHDLGGFGVAENLFPITSGANSDHSIVVEADVKDHLAEANKRQQNHGAKDVGIRVHYSVDVENKDQIANNAFNCSWNLVDPKGGNLSTKNYKIHSMAQEERGWHGGGSGRKTPGWAHGNRKGNRAGDLQTYTNAGQITGEELTTLTGKHSSTVSKLAPHLQELNANPQQFAALLMEYDEKVKKFTMDKDYWRNWFWQQAASEEGLDVIEDQMDLWREEIDNIK